MLYKRQLDYIGERVHYQDVKADRKRWIYFPLLFFIIICFLILLLFHRELARQVRIFDAKYTSLHFKDMWGRIYWQEDWSNAPSAALYDFKWLDDAQMPIRIAHALGESGSATQNSIDAARRSVNKGFKLLEFDVWLHESGKLLCHHGPDAPDINTFPRGTSSECQVEELFHYLKNQPEIYLISDIKTNFEQTADALLDLAARQGLTDRIIMQLYHPRHLIKFELWQRKFRLPAPIITVYLSHLPIWRIQDSLAGKGYRAIALPMEFSQHVRQVHEDIYYFTHPVHDCEAYSEAIKPPLRGVYMLNSINCGNIDATGRH